MLFDDVIWEPGGLRRIDPRDCAVLGPLDAAVAGFTGVQAGPVWYTSSDAEGHTVTRVDMGGGEPTEPTSTDLGRLVNGLLPHGDSLWVAAGADVVRLDATTLDVESDTTAFECADWAYPVAVARESLWLVNDCDGVLARVDTSSGAVTERYLTPLDGVSDSELSAVAVDDGIWLVDAEQTGEPYFFSYDRERFERLPDTLRSPDLYALDFHVRPWPRASYLVLIFAWRAATRSLKAGCSSDHT
jgi:hypothetical protein